MTRMNIFTEGNQGNEALLGFRTKGKNVTLGNLV
jgi:hypothetical protein